MKNVSTNVVPPEENEPTQPTLSNEVSCEASEASIRERVTEPYSQVTESAGAGRAEVQGTIVIQEQELWDTQAMVVYLRVASATPQAFIDSNRERVERGNTVNRIEEGALLYKLGTLENGALVSTADVSERARAAIEEGNTVTLQLEVPLHQGSGAPPHFSYACTIAL